jgi:hypothetical protein
MSAKRSDLISVWAEHEVEGWTALPRGMRLALGRQGVPDIRRQTSGLGTKLAKFCGKYRLIRRLAPLGKRRLVTLSWARDSTAFPDAYYSEMVPWIFDCWGPEWPEWEKLLRRHKVRLAFFTARTSLEHFTKVVPGLTGYWLPEAMELSLLYPGKPLAERSVHVLEMGRKLVAMHEKICEPLVKAGKKHVYDKSGAQAAGAVRGLDELYRTMGDSAIVICYPKTLTNAQGAGGVETVTQRYLETIGSGSLVVGYCPKELEELLGFDPTVKLSDTDPAGHMLDILANLPTYQAQVDRARARLNEVGSFDTRAAQMLAKIDEFDRANGKPTP